MSTLEKKNSVVKNSNGLKQSAASIETGVLHEGTLILVGFGEASRLMTTLREILMRNDALMDLAYSADIHLTNFRESLHLFGTELSRTARNGALSVPKSVYGHVLDGLVYMSEFLEADDDLLSEVCACVQHGIDVLKENVERVKRERKHHEEQERARALAERRSRFNELVGFNAFEGYTR